MKHDMCKPDRSTELILWSIGKLAMQIAEGKAILNDEDKDYDSVVTDTLANCTELLKRYLDEEVMHWLPQAIHKERSEVKQRCVSVQITNS